MNMTVETVIKQWGPIFLLSILLFGCASEPPVNIIGQTRTTENIRAVFTRADVEQQFFKLYKQRLAFDKELRGKITYRLTVSQQGEVLSCHVAQSSLADIELEQAIRNVLLGTNFGVVANPEPVRFLYPIRFEPSQSSGQ